MFNGYLSLGGTEIINAARTVAYVTKNAPSIPLRDCVDCGDLNTVLDEETYESPLVDDAPWFDPNNMSTNGFFGLYPLSIEGLEDSTRTAAVTESIVDGGSVGSIRYGTRAIRVRGLLMANDEYAMSTGMAWLRNALDPAPCSDHGGTCGGAQMCYYAACPEVCDIFEPFYLDGFSTSIFQQTPAFGRAVFARQLAYDGLWKAQINLQSGLATEGMIVRYGAVSQSDSSVELESHGPVVLKRINYVPNPEFNTLTGWSYVGGTATLTPGITGDYLFREGGTEDGVTTVTLRTDDMPGVYPGETIASFRLWMPDVEAAQPWVVVRLRNSDDDSIIAEGSFAVDSILRRYSLLSPGGGPSYLEFETGGDIAIDSVMLEAGQVALPFFSGNTSIATAMSGYRTVEVDPEYEIKWLGEADNSPSQALWLGTMAIGAPMEDYSTSLGGVCDAFPFLQVVQGTVTASLDVEIRDRIPADIQTQHLERTLHEVTCVEGPTIIGEKKLTSGAIMREVDFLLIAGRPAAYGPTRTMLNTARMIDLPTVEWVDINCDEVITPPIIDPDCAPAVSPPRPPTIPNLCVTPETTWQRYWLAVPGDYVSTWAGTSPQVTITSGVNEIRQVRVRAYPNPFGRVANADTAYRANIATNGGLKFDDSGWGYWGWGMGGRVVGDSPYCGINIYRIEIEETTAPEDVSAMVGNLDDYWGDQRLVNPVTPGMLIRPSIYGRTSATHDVRFRYTFLDADGIALPGEDHYEAAFTTTGGTWHRFAVAAPGPITVPSGAVQIAVSLHGVASDVDYLIGETFSIAGLTIEVSNAWGTYAFNDEWWDADRLAEDCSSLSADGFYYSWTGEPGLSTSEGVRTDVDPCSFCAEFVVSYLPANTTLTVDSILERAFASVAGGDAVSANHLMYSGTDGSPMIWPELACGMDYLLAIDVPEPLLDDVTVTVTLTTKE